MPSNISTLEKNIMRLENQVTVIIKSDSDTKHQGFITFDIFVMGIHTGVQKFEIVATIEF